MAEVNALVIAEHDSAGVRLRSSTPSPAAEQLGGRDHCLDPGGGPGVSVDDCRCSHRGCRQGRQADVQHSINNGLHAAADLPRALLTRLSGEPVLA